MNALRHPAPEADGSPAARRFPGVWLLAVAAAFALLVWLGRLSSLEALLAAAVIGVVVFWSTRPASRAIVDRAPSSAPAASANATLAALVDALADPAIAIDARGTIVAANAAAATFGIRQTGESLSLSLRVPEVLDAIRAAADGKPHEVEFTERGPVERLFLARVSPVASLEPGLILLTFRDLTQARQLDRMRADFVANASHELRTPLASLAGFIETLQGPARDDAAARERFLAIMREQAWRMSRLVDDLLSLSRLELDRHLLPETVVELGALVAQVCDSLNPVARERGVTFDIQRAAPPLAVRGERDDLVRLFENLVENALKYGATGKRVEIAMAAEGDEAVVTVRDFGPGIAPEHLPRLTERFYRVDVSASREQGGTGLGLAIVKHILARHRGRLAIESELGQGAIFTVRLPLAGPESRDGSAA
jgi:two-component system phosphate regulon sensor histidine kinase PhoR